EPERLPGQQEGEAVAQASEERTQELHSAHARPGAPLASRALRLGAGARRRLQRRRARRTAGGAAADLSRRSQEGGRHGRRHEREALRQASSQGAGPPAHPLRCGRLPTGPAPRRDDVHLDRDRAHPRGLLRLARVRGQPRPARLEDARSRRRQPAARLLDLLRGEGRLQRAAAPPHVDAQSRRAATRRAHAASDLGRCDPHPGFDHHGSRLLRRVNDSMATDDVLGNASLGEPFDFCIIGSGAGGGTAAHVLTAAGKSVLVLEAGGNPFPGLDQSAPLPFPLHSNDELKYSVRNFINQDPFLEPRTFRTVTSDAGSLMDDVNTLPKAVGGAFQHADAKTPRFNAIDFRLKSAVEELIGRTPGLAVPGFGADAASANFADWPFTYADLEPFYVEAELLYGVQGDGDNIYESQRSHPYRMPAGGPMYFALLLADGAKRGLVPRIRPPHPPAPHTRASEPPRAAGPPDEPPPWVDCALCSGFGCPNTSKNPPAVTTLRRPLLSGNCQLRFNAVVTRLVFSGRVVSGAEYVDGAGNVQTVSAHNFILAASAIESARLCLLSDPAG